MTPIEMLSGEPEHVNPAILLAEEFMRRDASALLSAEDIERAERILQVGRNEIETIRKQLAAFDRTTPAPSMNIPTGF